jgi:hypothetical protein
MGHLDLQDMPLAASTRIPLGRLHADEETPTSTRRQEEPADQERIGLRVLTKSLQDSERKGPPLRRLCAKRQMRRKKTRPWTSRTSGRDHLEKGDYPYYY